LALSVGLAAEIGVNERADFVSDLWRFARSSKKIQNRKLLNFLALHAEPKKSDSAPSAPLKRLATNVASRFSISRSCSTSQRSNPALDVDMELSF
jgi:hypothetical protein